MGFSAQSFTSSPERLAPIMVIEFPPLLMPVKTPIEDSIAGVKADGGLNKLAGVQFGMTAPPGAVRHSVPAAFEGPRDWATSEVLRLPFVVWISSLRAYPKKMS